MSADMNDPRLRSRLGLRLVRSSVLIALAALLFSALLHVMGLPLVFRGPLNAADTPPAETPPPIAVEFEDFVAELTEPEPPQEPQQPEPPEPAEEVLPTSEAQVASENPEQTLSPGTGEAEPQQPQTPDTTPEAPAPPPPAPQQPVETQAEPAAAPAPAETAPQAPAQSETAEPDSQIAALQPLPETSAPGDLDTGAQDPSDLAVTTSPRPRVPDNRPETEPDNTVQQAPANPRDLLRPPETPIESPLDAYRRDPNALTTWQGTASASGSGGVGNSTTTNYAGQVLVQLNNTAPSRVSGSGSAQVFFEINANGTLAWVKVVSSTGAPGIIRAAKDQVTRSAPFPPTPTGRSVRLSFSYRSN